MSIQTVARMIRGALEELDFTQCAKTWAREVLTGDIHNASENKVIQRLRVDGTEYEIAVTECRPRSYQIIFTAAVLATSRMEAVEKAKILVNGGDSAVEIVEGCDCSRVRARMACDECGYPLCEAMVDTDASIPHDCTVRGSVD